MTSIDKQHREILDSFRSGATHLLVATSVAEEGIDIRACDLVIHFDQIRTQAVLLQTAGRARHKDARVVVLTENSDVKQMAMVQQMQTQKQSTHELANSKPVPENDEELLEQVLYDPAFRILVESTGATVTLGMEELRLEFRTENGIGGPKMESSNIISTNKQYLHSISELNKTYLKKYELFACQM